VFENSTAVEIKSSEERLFHYRNPQTRIPEDIAAILGAADSFIRDFTGKALGVIGGK